MFVDSIYIIPLQKHNVDFSRDELVERILHGDIIWRERYIEFIREGRYSLMYDMGREIHRILSKTGLDLQYGCEGCYAGYGYGRRNIYTE